MGFLHIPGICSSKLPHFLMEPVYTIPTSGFWMATRTARSAASSWKRLGGWVEGGAQSSVETGRCPSFHLKYRPLTL